MLPHFNFAPDADIISRTRWYIAFRWLYIVLLAVPTGILIYALSGPTQSLSILLLAGAAAAGLNGIFYITSRLLRTAGQYQILAALIPAADIIIVTYAIALLESGQSQGVLLYAIPIIMSAAMLGRKGIYGAAIASLLSYNAVFLNGPRIHSSEEAYNLLFTNMALIAILLAVDYILRLLRQKERQALKIVDDLTRAQAVGKFGSWEMDRQTGTVAWSAEAYRLLGLPVNTAELSFDDYLGFVFPAHRRLLRSVMKRVAERPRRFRVEYQVTTASGEPRYFHAEGESLPDRSGRVVTIVGTMRDTTEERQFDQTQNEFVSLASHQLRTPATVIKQYLSMLLDGYAGELTDKQKGFLQTAKDTNDRHIAIVNTLLDVAQLESGKVRLKLAKTDIVALLGGLVKEYRLQAENKRQVLLFRSRYKHLYCEADAYHLRTVLENIIDNALRYSPASKTVTVRLGADARMVSVSVIDEGVGIAAEDMTKLFKKFSRIEHPDTFHEQGAGLGLYWSDKIIALHGGRVEAMSLPGKGSTFKVVIPRSKQPKKRSKKR